MERRDFLAAAALIPSASIAGAPTLREQVLGAWRIRDAETVNVTNGTTQPWLGRRRPYSGMIVYLPNGMMSVQIGAARDPARKGAGFGTLTVEDKTTYADTWYAYYGRFEIDEAESKVRHIIEESLLAFESGTTYVRTVHLKDGMLTLRTVDLLKGPEGETFNRLSWTRI